MSSTTIAEARPLPSPRILAFRVVYAALTLNFLLPAISYIVAPEMTYQTVDNVNRLLGGGAYAPETGHLWHMLAVGNVMTLAFLCGMLFFDLKRYFPALPALVFLKGFSAVYSLFIGFANGIPFFFAVFVLDGVSTWAMWFFATRAHREMTRAGGMAS